MQQKDFSNWGGGNNFYWRGGASAPLPHAGYAPAPQLISILKEKRADAGTFRSTCEESGNRDQVETEYSEKAFIRSTWSGSGIGSEFEMFEQESHKSFNTAMEDLPSI